MTRGPVKLYDENGRLVVDGSLSPAPGGGSQTVKVLGPYTLDHTTLSGDGDEVTLFATTAGDVLLGGFYDVETVVDWVSSGSPDMAIGEDPPGPTYTPLVAVFGFDPTQLLPGDGVAYDLITGAGAGGKSAVAAGSVFTCMRVFGGGHMKVIMDDSGHGTSSAGSADFYFLVATPTLTP